MATLRDVTNRAPPASAYASLAYNPPKEVRLKDPRSTRHRGVLTLRKAVKVYDMRAASSGSFEEIIQVSRAATAVFKTKKISTRRLVKRNDASDLADMEITIHGDTRKSYENDSSGSEHSITFVISIPQEWTPKVFLALLNRSIRENNAVSLEKVSHRDMSCFSLNEVNCFYLCDLHSLDEVLLMEGAYVGVFGGCMNH
jgi:hypothetical protein